MARAPRIPRGEPKARPRLVPRGPQGRAGQSVTLNASFRVFIDQAETGVAYVSPIHWLDAGLADPELRQTVRLRRAIDDSRLLFAWREACAHGKRDVRTVRIVQLDSPGGRPINCWSLRNAFATRWTGPSFDAMRPDIACEELEVSYESVAWEGPSAALDTRIMRSFRP